MKLTEKQLQALGTALANLETETETTGVKVEDKPVKTETETTAVKVEDKPVKSETETTPLKEETKRVKLGTPVNTDKGMSVDSLNSRSVEWMAQNIDKVNKLITN